MARVVNLNTGEERDYSLTSKDAVIAAWEQSRGNWNTWDYAQSKAPVEFGRLTVLAGDWCCLLRGDK